MSREEWEIPKEGRDPPPPQHRGRRGALPECGTHPIRPMATPHGGHGRARAAVGRGGGCQPLQGIRLRGELIPWARGPRISMVRPCSRSLLCERPARRGEEGGKFAKAPTDAWPEVARNRWKKEITGNKEKGRRELRGDVLVALRGRQKRPKGAGTGPRNPPPLSPHRVAQGATQRLSEEGV